MPLKARQLCVGDQGEEVAVDNRSRTQIVQYAGASGDYNPIHSDTLYTIHAAGYPSLFARGMLTMGLATKMLTHYVGDTRLATFRLRSIRQVFPNSLTAKCTVEGLREEDGVHLIDIALSAVN